MDNFDPNGHLIKPNSGNSPKLSSNVSPALWDQWVRRAETQLVLNSLRSQLIDLILQTENAALDPRSDDRHLRTFLIKQATLRQTINQIENASANNR